MRGKSSTSGNVPTSAIAACCAGMHVRGLGTAITGWWKCRGGSEFRSVRLLVVFHRGRPCTAIGCARACVWAQPARGAEQLGARGAFWSAREDGSDGSVGRRTAGALAYAPRVGMCFHAVPILTSETFGSPVVSEPRWALRGEHASWSAGARWWHLIVVGYLQQVAHAEVTQILGVEVTTALPAGVCEGSITAPTSSLAISRGGWAEQARPRTGVPCIVIDPMTRIVTCHRPRTLDQMQNGWAACEQRQVTLPEVADLIHPARSEVFHGMVAELHCHAF
jgi:hypothetical protein